MAIETALFQPVSGDAAITYSARQFRNLVIGGMVSREGVADKNAGHLAVTQRGAGANMSVDVAIGKAYVFGDDASDQGTYSINSNTVVNVAIPAASTSTSRTHRVILRVRDKLENSSWTTYDAVVEVQANTTAGAALPASSIVLATVTTPANATSVTNAMVTDLRARGSVGTPDITGSFSLRTAYYAQEDASRPLRYAVNPDGRVLLSGFVRFVRTGGANHPNYPVSANVQNQMTEFVLPTDIRPVNASYRDFIGPSSGGPTLYSVQPTGHLTFMSWTAVTHVSGSTWFSFDGCSYLL